MPEMTLPPSVVMSQMLAGFQVSQALYVLTKLDICTMLDEGPASIDELAERSGAAPHPLRRLIRSLAPMGLFRTDGDVVATTPLGALLSRGNPETLANVAEMWMETHYGPFGELLHTVRTEEPGGLRYFGKPALTWIAEEPERAALFTRAMTDVTGSLRKNMFSEYDLPPGRVVADIGGSDGSLLAELIKSRPERHGIVFDQPAIAPHATKAMAERGLSERVEVVGGDFFAEVPAADIYLLCFVLHDWNDEESGQILATIRRAAAPGARLLVVEGVMPEGDIPHLTKMTDLTMLGLVSGRERMASDFADLLSVNGWSLDHIIPTPSAFSIIEATVL